MNIPIANIYYLLCYAWDRFEDKETLAEIGAVDFTDLIELFARVLVTGSRRLRRRGFDRGYLPQEGELGGVRGKLLVTTTLRRNLLRRGLAACEWDELEYDTLPNRILKTTLQRINDHTDLGNKARADIYDLLRWLKPVQQIQLRSEHFRRVQLHHNNRIYGLLLQICEYVHEHWLPDEGGNGRQFQDFVRDGLPKLFEKFVFNFYRRELPKGWNVNASQIKWDIETQNNDAKNLLPGMQTDICLLGPERAIILDTKFYAEALKMGKHGSAKLHPGNLYQIFTYLRQRSAVDGWKKAEGILLYPHTTSDFAVDFTTHGHRIQALTLDLSKPWKQIHDQLLKAIGVAAPLKEMFGHPG